MPKGHTNNPNGRPRRGDSAAEAIRSALSTRDWKNAAKSLLDILCVEVEDELTGEKKIIPNPTTNGRDRAAAYNALADRAFGKPIQKQVIQEETTPPIDEQQLQDLRDEIIGGDLV